MQYGNQEGSDNDLLKMATSVEHGSEYPLGLAIVEEVRRWGISLMIHLIFSIIGFCGILLFFPVYGFGSP